MPAQIGAVPFPPPQGATDPPSLDGAGVPAQMNRQLIMAQMLRQKPPVAVPTAPSALPQPPQGQ